MKAMILAAGRGERLRPLTDTVPKPLVVAGGKPLVEWHLQRLAAAGIREIVINVSHLAHAIEARLGDGRRWDLSIAYSREPQALETAGGIAQARPLLGDAPFLLVNADVWCDADLGRLARAPLATDAAHLLLVRNPDFRPQGDFSLAEGPARDDAGLKVMPRHTGVLPGGPVNLTYGHIGLYDAAPRYTYSGLALVAPRLVDGIAAGTRAPLGPLLRAAASRGELSGTLHEGAWSDVGTAERLAALDAQLQTRKRP